MKCGFWQFIREKDGWFPIKIEALPEGSVVYPHVPVFQITAEGEYASLVTYLETVLLMAWVCRNTPRCSLAARATMPLFLHP